MVRARERFRVCRDLPAGTTLPDRRNEEDTLERIATAHFGQLLSERDPQRAGEWFATLPPRVVSKETATAVVAGWYDRSPEEVARWIESLPAGTNRDEATRVFVEQALIQSPAGAAAWVETISDPVLRTKAAERLFWEMKRDDAVAARVWLTNVPGVDEAWRMRTLRRTR